MLGFLRKASSGEQAPAAPAQPPASSACAAAPRPPAKPLLPANGTSAKAPRPASAAGGKRKRAAGTQQVSRQTCSRPELHDTAAASPVLPPMSYFAAVTGVVSQHTVQRSSLQAGSSDTDKCAAEVHAQLPAPLSSSRAPSRTSGCLCSQQRLSPCVQQLVSPLYQQPPRFVSSAARRSLASPAAAAALCRAGTEQLGGSL